MNLILNFWGKKKKSFLVHAVKAYRGSRGIAPLHGGECLTSHPRRLPPEKNSRAQTAGCLGPGGGMDVLKKRISFSYGESNRTPSGCQIFKIGIALPANLTNVYVKFFGVPGE
jgi:hypothetical protein